MGLAVKVYEAFKDDEKKAKVLSEVIDELEGRTLPFRDVATKGDLEVTKLALQKEIEEVRREIEEVRREIEEVRREIEEVRREIEEVRGEVREVELRLQAEIERIRSSIIKWVVGLLLVQTGVIVSLFGLLR